MSKSQGNTSKHSSDPRQEFDSQVSSLLKSMYGAVEDEGIPEKFLDLLERLDKAEQVQADPKG